MKRTSGVAGLVAEADVREVDLTKRSRSAADHDGDCNRASASSASSDASAPLSYASLPVKELKSILAARGVDFSDCVEKEDLIERCKQHAGAEALLSRAGGPPGVHHLIEQNTPKWFHMRRGDYDVRIGGSEIGVVTGVSVFSKPYSLWEKIIGQTDGTWENSSETIPACEHGDACEPLIADMYARYTKADLDAGGYYQHPHPQLGELYGASPDRRILSKGGEGNPVPAGETVGLVEIKAPFGRMYTHVKDDHMAQIQYQLWCSGLEYCDYVAVKLDHNTPEKTFPSNVRVLLARVYRSEEYIQWMMPRLFLFSRCLILRVKMPPGLYDDEKMGKEDPPNPRVELTVVENGAWVVQKCKQCNSPFHAVGRRTPDCKECVACEATEAEASAPAPAPVPPCDDSGA